MNGCVGGDDRCFGWCRYDSCCGEQGSASGRSRRVSGVDDRATESDGIGREETDFAAVCRYGRRKVIGVESGEMESVSETRTWIAVCGDIPHGLCNSDHYRANDAFSCNCCLLHRPGVFGGDGGVCAFCAPCLSTLAFLVRLISTPAAFLRDRS